MTGARIVTLNVAGLGIGWFEGRFDSTVSGLRDWAPDILCLQETTLRHETTLYDQSAELGHALGLRYTAFTPYGNPPEVTCCEEGGVAIVARWPLVASRSRRLVPGHDRERDSRSAVLATFDAPDGEIHVVNTHFSWRPEEEEIRLMQMRLLLHEMESAGWLVPGARTVLCGDLNGPDEEPAVHAAASYLADSWHRVRPEEPGFTWDNRNPYTQRWPLPDRRLDYVFCASGLEPRRAEIILQEPRPVVASDHYGLFVELVAAGSPRTPDRGI